MKVKELIELLQKHDPEKIIVMSADPEGNYFYKFSGGITTGLYVGGWGGEVWIEELTDERILQGYSEDDIYTGDDAEPAVVLWP